mmetsp:Transcript_69608/g.193695  ORF Transcript_69608/g.193695 Transcript_69608/m.193695 type:complete len:202 (-) Transcript_69608:2400-3005(-)
MSVLPTPLLQRLPRRGGPSGGPRGPSPTTGGAPLAALWPTVTAWRIPLLLATRNEARGCAPGFFRVPTIALGSPATLSATALRAPTLHPLRRATPSAGSSSVPLSGAVLPVVWGHAVPDALWVFEGRLSESLPLAPSTISGVGRLRYSFPWRRRAQGGRLGWRHTRGGTPAGVRRTRSRNFYWLLLFASICCRRALAWRIP